MPLLFYFFTERRIIMSIAENVARIKENIRTAALSVGRDPDSILLCAATKMNGADAVCQAIAAGVNCCGENRVQGSRAWTG